MRGETEILETLARFSRLVWARDPAVMETFADDADILLVASDAGVTGRGPSEVFSLLSGVFALPERIRWEWRDRIVTRQAEIAWFFAEGEMILEGEEGQTRLPYRASGVLQLDDGQWRFRMFHGSEPRL